MNFSAIGQTKAIKNVFVELNGICSISMDSTSRPQVCILVTRIDTFVSCPQHCILGSYTSLPLLQLLSFLLKFNNNSKDIFLNGKWCSFLGLNLLVFPDVNSSKYVSIQNKVRIIQSCFTPISTKYVSYIS